MKMICSWLLLFFVRGGIVVSASSTQLRLVGQFGYYWSSRAYSTTSNAYSLYFAASGVYPSNYGDYRYAGFSLRCLIPTT